MSRNSLKTIPDITKQTPTEWNPSMECNQALASGSRCFGLVFVETWGSGVLEFSSFVGGSDAVCGFQEGKDFRHLGIL
jgi:hypothetical protein